MTQPPGSDAHGPAATGARRPPTPNNATARPDLAAMIEPLRHDLLRTETEILTGLGLTMWGYVVLLNLSSEPIRTQAALADAIRADRTRIIEVLDALQERDLISRRPDPADRRARLLALTAEGQRLRGTAQAAIQAREERLLSVLTPSARAGFLNALQVLSGAPARARLRPEDPSPATDSHR